MSENQPSQDDLLERLRRLTRRMDDREIALWRLFTHTDDLVCVVKGEEGHPGVGVFQLVSPSFERVLGWTESMILGKTWSLIVHPEDIGCAQEVLVKGLETGHFKTRNRVVDSDNATYRWFEWVCVRQDATETWYCFGRDITELVETQEALDATLTRLAALVETAVDAVITIDESSHLVEPFNSAASHMFGYEKEELVGKTIEVLMPEPERTEHGAAVRRYIATGVSRGVVGETREVRGLHRDGTVFPIEISVSETRVRGRRYFHGVIRDLRKVRR